LNLKRATVPCPMRLLLAATLAACVSFAGCTSVPTLCSSCPNLAGSYELVWGGNRLAPCPGATAPSDRHLDLAQDGATLNGRMGALTLIGNVFEDGAAALSGIPTGSDAGTSLTSSVVTLTLNRPELDADGITARALTGQYTASGGVPVCTFSVDWSAYRF
jgi:hypothetical protein